MPPPPRFGDLYAGDRKASFLRGFLRFALKRNTSYTIMGFQFDPGKSDRNLVKHGTDFVEAQRLWNGQNLLEIPVRIEDEPRFIVIGRIDARHWSALVTYRSDAIRIISVRRSRDEEVVLYES